MNEKSHHSQPINLAQSTDREISASNQRKTRILPLAGNAETPDESLDQTSAGFDLPHPDFEGDLDVGSQIGPYKLLQEIGIGGMGVVYMADQSQPVRRKVALKIIKLGMDTRNFIARFEAERQALAMMDHPNITKIFDAGRTSTGRPFFAMELVSGLAITEYCDKRKLSLRQRLELFQNVCLGVQHAHQKGIIHRDLKPSNVMVTHYDGVAVPKIIDFGISKAIDQSLTDKTLFTSYGNMIGTPEYMSPEQAEMSGLDVDTRSDVYSLGVVLYELLTGTTPFYKWKKKGVHKFCEAICQEEPELASTRVNNLADTVNEISRNRGTDSRSLNRLLRGDLDWILAKCMAKNRNQRYESAADLARDVQRYLSGQPIEAAGPRLSYRVRKFVTKYRTGMAGAAVIFVSMVGATIVSALFALQATKSQQLANARLVEVDQLRREAVAERDRAQAAEQRLQVLERQSRNEAATARAITRFKEEFPNDLIGLKFPSRPATPGVGWSPEVKRVLEDSREMIPRQSKIETETVTAFNSPAGQKSTSQVVRISHPGDYACNVAITSDGELKLTRSQLSADGTLVCPDLPENQSIQFFVVQDPDGKDQTDKFLDLLADEQRKLFGENDRMLANTLLEIGGMALRNKDWTLAENKLRECEGIFEKNDISDERLAKVKLLLGQALLNQDKIAAAKETLMNSLNNLDDLSEVSDELAETYRDMKHEFEKLDIPFAEIGVHLKKELGGLLKEAVQEHLKKKDPRQ